MRNIQTHVYVSYDNLSTVSFMNKYVVLFNMASHHESYFSGDEQKITFETKYSSGKDV